MRSVRGKPSEKSACQVDLLTVLVCPITFPTPSTLLRALNATQDQVTESASEWAERVTESASGWAERVAESASGWAERANEVSQAAFEFLNGDDSTAEVLTEPEEHLTTQQVSDGGWTASDWITLGGNTIIASIVVLAVGYKIYEVYCPSRDNAAGIDSYEPLMIPLRGIDLPGPAAASSSGLHTSNWSRPTAPDMTPSHSNTVPSPSAPPAGPDSPPPYEAPPTYDSSCPTPKCPTNGSD
eukprot:Blabericola_migrator_1__5183@NODE_2672_length_2477_cov_94_662656_g1652_i1_p1_GENE_NODE_2672_length_2477_cov_94_662656_g1652_i1NODE_2672_length_2477_cov_94_662656_g1652_i1_p1_ORF_typecomplete_len241_score31_08Apolipoprotein/PF01442_18/0_082YtxH/PF12732_7/0_25_NODE_2672_length_2477_cov_94_662656_g1652_i127749